jgi:hypothetical protein
MIAILFPIIASMPGSALGAVANFSALDDNPYSPRYNTMVSPYDATNRNTVTMWYHQYNEY